MNIIFQLSQESGFFKAKYTMAMSLETSPLDKQSLKKYDLYNSPLLVDQRKGVVETWARLSLLPFTFGDSKAKEVVDQVGELCRQIKVKDLMAGYTYSSTDLAKVFEVAQMIEFRLRNIVDSCSKAVNFGRGKAKSHEIELTVHYPAQPF